MDKRTNPLRSQRGARQLPSHVGQERRQISWPRKPLLDQFYDGLHRAMTEIFLWGCAIALGLFLSGVVASVVVFALLHLTGADTGAVVTVGKFIGFAGAIVIALSVIYRLVILFSTGISKLRFGAGDFLSIIGIVVGIAGILIGHYWK